VNTARDATQATAPDMVQISDESPLTPEAAELFALSDAFAAALYPAESNHMVDPSLLAQPHVIFCVARQNGRALGCGAAVLYGGMYDGSPAEPPYAEIKRMYVHEDARGLGLGRRILHYLEQQTAARGVRTLRLETGVISHAARRLYEKCGYYQIPPFGDYWDDPLSIFYEKIL
jgi:putative acetyltransferase